MEDIVEYSTKLVEFKEDIILKSSQAAWILFKYKGVSLCTNRQFFHYS